MKTWPSLALALLCLAPSQIHCAQPRLPDSVLNLWPGNPPGDTRIQGPEKRVAGRPRPFYQITDIATPSLEVFLPPQTKANRTAILVCPGGGLQRLAYEHEGLEVAHWLNSIGITAFVLKYRVPAPASIGAQDAQRALGILRTRAAEWQIDPDAIGVLGFSAGGEIGAWLITHSDQRLYPAADPADQTSCRPDFAAFIYSGGLLQGRAGGLKPELNDRIRQGLPPVFLAHAFNDGCENSLQLALALKRAGVPTELHLFQEGGHGFGARETGVPVDSWKQLLAAWLHSLGVMDPAPVRLFADRLGTSLAQRALAPRLTDALPQATLADAYAAQRRIVRTLSATNRISGYKGGAISLEARANLGLEQPMVGALFRSGRLDGSEPQTIQRDPGAEIVVETEIGYITSVDISYEILNAEQARGAVQSIVPIIELPNSIKFSPGAANGRDVIAANIGSARYIVGKPTDPDALDPSTVAITLQRDGQILHQAAGKDAPGGPWELLRNVLNQITRHGYTIPAGSIILGGALGKIQPGLPGAYQAQFEPLGNISFEIR